MFRIREFKNSGEQSVGLALGMNMDRTNTRNQHRHPMLTQLLERLIGTSKRRKLWGYSQITKNWFKYQLTTRNIDHIQIQVGWHKSFPVVLHRLG